MSDEWLLMLPLALLGGGAVLVYGVARLISRHNGVLAGITAALYASALLTLLPLYRDALGGQGNVLLMNGSPILQADSSALLMVLIALGLGVLVSLYSGAYLALDRQYENYYPLLLLLGAGVAGMVMAKDLFTLYLLTVLTSAANYVLVAFRRRTETAIEAGYKYAIMGGMASIVILTGIGYLYRSGGSLTLPLAASASSGWGALGLGLVLGGYMVKSAIVPAHTWLPDAHGRAPSSISAMLSGIILQAYLYVMVKVGLGMGMAGERLGLLLLVLALPTMTLGNLLALRQSYGKRLLAYSSIAHSGYMIAGFGLGLFYDRPEPIAAAFFMVGAHAAMKGSAFLCKGIAHLYCDATLLRDLEAFAYRLPLPAACFTVALAGLAGLVPLAGFTAKVVMLQSFFRLGGTVGILVALALVLNSLVALGYYVPMIGRMLHRRQAGLHEGARISPAEASRPRVSLWMLSPVVVLGLVVLFLGVVPGPLLALAGHAAADLLAWGRVP